MEKITIRKFLIWFYSNQSKGWLVSEAVKDQIDQMNWPLYGKWEVTAKECGFELEP